MPPDPLDMSSLWPNFTWPSRRGMLAHLWEETIELLHIECVLCHVTGVQFDRKICPCKSAILDFLQKLPFAFAQNFVATIF